MGNHPNRGWRGRWTVEGREARHGPSGLVVRFSPHPEGGWSGTSPNAQVVFQALQAAGTQDLERVLSRLMREAADIFSERNHE
jgi:hypothetical protein